MPICLVAIALLSLTAIVLIEAVSSAADRTALQQNIMERRWTNHNIEQQVIWRALVEQAEQSTSSEFQATPAHILELLNSTGPWDTRSTTISWKGIQNNSDVSSGRFKVQIQDAKGLLDVNNTNPAFLNFIARTVDIPPTARQAAVNQLIARVAEFKSATLVGEEQFRSTRISGINRATDLCNLNQWSESSVCSRELSVFRSLTFGAGTLPNIRLSPVDLRRRMGLSEEDYTSVSGVLEWEEIQRREGFYDPIFSLGPGGRRLHVWIDDQQHETTSFFILDLSTSSLGAPYTVANRFTENTALSFPD